MSGQFGQVSILFSRSGGCDRISKIGHRQRSLPDRGADAVGAGVAAADDDNAAAARIGSPAAAGSPLTRRFCCGKKSMAKWMPSSSRPGTGRSRGFSAPPVRDDRIVVGNELVGGEVDADMRAVVEHHALGLHLRDAAVDVMLFHLEVGNAVAKQPAGLGKFFRRRGSHARRVRVAARRPGLPSEPTVATFLLLRLGQASCSSPLWRGRPSRIRSI